MQYEITPSTWLVPVAALCFAACSGDYSTAPLSPSGPSDVAALSRQARSSSDDIRIARCPTRLDQTASSTIGPAGGMIELAGHNLSIPPGAVSTPTRFSLHVPSGRDLRIELTAEGFEHYEFRGTASVTISYERCHRQQISERVPSAWYIGDNGDRVRQATVNDPVARSVSFETSHLSTYAVLY